MKNLSLFLVLFFILIGKSFSQNEYNVDYSEIKGSLSKTDKYKIDFGKYRGYQIPLFQNETVNFVLYSSEFNGKIILVDPEGIIYKQTAEAQNGFNSILTTIPKSGDWIVYVVGDQNDSGNFILRYATADANSINYNSNMDFCSTLNFLIAHANAQFMMLQINSANNDVPKLPNTKESFIDAESSAFINIIAEDNETHIKSVFEQFSSYVKNCLSDWKFVNAKTINGNSITMKNSESITLRLEYFPQTAQKDVYQLILKIIKE